MIYRLGVKHKARYRPSDRQCPIFDGLFCTILFHVVRITSVRLSSMRYLTSPTSYPPTLSAPGMMERISDPTTFAALCEFWEIVREILQIYRPEESPLNVSLAFALSKYHKLLIWADSLSTAITRNEHSPAHVLVFQ
jgi:hypothetical protein